MTTFRPSVYPNSAAIAIALASLASTVADPPVGQESAEIDQTVARAVDELIDGQITTGTSPTAGRRIRIWVWGGAYDGSTARRPAGATGSNAGLTPTADYKTGFQLLHWIDTDGTSNKTYKFAGLSLRRAFGGLYLPARWGLFVDHNTVAALNGTAGNHGFSRTTLTDDGT